jgi:hypothetical protein
MNDEKAIRQVFGLGKSSAFFDLAAEDELPYDALVSGGREKGR